MRQYRPYNKRAIVKVMESNALGFDIMKPFDWWDTGAKELEKTTLGKAVTSPIRIPQAVVSSGVKTVKEVPVTVKKISNIIPLFLISAAIVGTAVIVYKFNIRNRGGSL
jgi:hypothetical protein